MDALRTATVRRADVDVSILAQGVTQCSRAISVSCELESLGAGAQSKGSSSTILTLIPEGTHVKEGDLLCELDASEYEDLLQQQRIKVAQATAEKRQAELNVEIAEIAAKQFKEGLNDQTEKGFLGQIALVRSDMQRAADRVNWSHRMKDKGYVSVAQVATEQTTLQRARLSVELAEMTLVNYRRFTFPMQLRGYDSQIAGARATLDFQIMRLIREQERLALYERQVEKCTIRAPHDGLAVYANEPGKRAGVYVEAPVRQRQRLFYLPDVSEMEVGLFLHETVVSRVQIGMRAQIQVEALPDVLLEGHVVSVGRMPMFDNTKDSSNEVKIYQGRIKLDSTPAGLLPGMTTQVVLATDQRRDALVVPSEAVTVEKGHDFCYVVRGDHLERRAVTVSVASSNLLEVTKGLEEGDRVVLDPLLVGVSGATVAGK